MCTFPARILRKTAELHRLQQFVLLISKKPHVLNDQVQSSLAQLGAAWRSVLEDPGDAQNSSRWFYESRCLNLRRNNKQSYREMNVGSTLVYFRADSCRKRMWLRTLPVGQEACLIDGKSLARYFLNPKTLLSEGPWEWSSSIKLSQNIFLAAHTHHPWGLNLEMKDNTIHIFYHLFIIQSLRRWYRF